jgi:hypothetical protein
MAREFNRAHILAAPDSKLPERQIMEVLNVGRTAIWRTRAAYLQSGLEFALHDEAQPGKPRQYATALEAEGECSGLPRSAARSTALDGSATDRGGKAPSEDEGDQPRDDPADAKKNLLKP